jgi:hypothetical protein
MGGVWVIREKQLKTLRGKLSHLGSAHGMNEIKAF